MESPLSFTYTLRSHPRARRLRITVYADQRVMVTVPRRQVVGLVDEYIRRQVPWIERALARLSQRPCIPPKKRTKQEVQRLKEQARQRIEERLAHFNVMYQFSYRRITVRDQKTRWGSCSRRGSLSFNYRIALLPEALTDYVIVHELCHLGEFNHSNRFWRLMKRALPDVYERRKLLKTYHLSTV